MGRAGGGKPACPGEQKRCAVKPWGLFPSIRRDALLLRGLLSDAWGKPRPCLWDLRLDRWKEASFSIADQSQMYQLCSTGDPGNRQAPWSHRAVQGMQRWIGELPPLPWRLSLLAVLARLLLARPAPSWMPASLVPWLSSLDELLLSYAALLLAAWLFYDLPTALRLWRAPAKILRDLALLLIMSALTVVIVQQQVRINLVSLVTASAVLTAVIGLAAQETLKDLFAGITLQLDSPFRLGD